MIRTIISGRFCVLFLPFGLGPPRVRSYGWGLLVPYMIVALGLLWILRGYYVTRRLEMACSTLVEDGPLRKGGVIPGREYMVMDYTAMGKLTVPWDSCPAGQTLVVKIDFFPWVSVRYGFPDKFARYVFSTLTERRQFLDRFEGTSRELAVTIATAAGPQTLKLAVTNEQLREILGSKHLPTHMVLVA